MENNTTLDIVVGESQKRRSDLIVDRLHEVTGEQNLGFYVPIESRNISLPVTKTILCTDESGLLVQISYNESTKSAREIRRYQSPNDMRDDVESIISRYNANKGSSISICYKVPQGISGYHALPLPMIRFVDGVTKKYEP